MKQFWKNGRLLPQSLFLLEHPEIKPATLCQASLILGCAWSSFPYKILSIGKCRQLQHNHTIILEDEERESKPERVPAQEPDSFL